MYPGLIEYQEEVRSRCRSLLSGNRPTAWERGFLNSLLSVSCDYKYTQRQLDKLDEVEGRIEDSVHTKRFW